MIFIFGGIAIVLIAIGTGVAIYRNRSDKRGNELPVLTNKYRNPKLREQRLLEWADAQDPDLGGWMREMHAKESKQLLKEVERFCKSKKFQIAWILDQQIEDENVQTALNSAILDFLRSQYTTDKTRKELEDYVALIDLLENVDSSRYQQKLQAIYLQLVNQHVIPQGNIEMLFSADRRRWKKAGKSIAIASRAERELVNLAIREHMLGEVPRAETLPKAKSKPQAVAPAAA